MKKSIIIIGSGMGGLAAGIYGRYNGFDTTIYEAHTQSGGQCTGWKRKGYLFDACIHSLNGFKPGTGVNRFWRELGAMPIERVAKKEFASFAFPDRTVFHNYFDVEKLEKHMKSLAPEDTAAVEEYIRGIRSFLKEEDLLGITNFGSMLDKLSLLPFFIPKLKLLKHTLGDFGRKFNNPYLRKAVPLFRYSNPDVPLFAYLAEHCSYIYGDTGWPRGGGLAFSGNMTDRYLKLGGTINYGKKVVRILTENDRARGIELEDGTRHTADFVVSNADGRKTVQEMLEGRYMNRKIARCCTPYPENKEIPFSVYVCLGVKRDLSSYPSSLILFPDKPVRIGGLVREHIQMDIYGFDETMAPPGKGVIKIELSGIPSYFSQFKDKAAYNAEKARIAEQLISLLEEQFPGIRDDIEVTDVSTLATWERFMGGTLGHNNYPRKYEDPTDIRNVLDFIFGWNKMFTLPGLKIFILPVSGSPLWALFSPTRLPGKTLFRKYAAAAESDFRRRSPIEAYSRAGSGFHVDGRRTALTAREDQFVYTNPHLLFEQIAEQLFLEPPARFRLPHQPPSLQKRRPPPHECCERFRSFSLRVNRPFMSGSRRTHGSSAV